MDKSNPRIAEFFRRLADLLEISSDNPFKTRSYRAAADTFEAMSESVARLARSGGAARLQEIPGVGKSIAAQTVELVQTGTSTVFEQLRESVPETVLELLTVRGIGMKTAQTLFRDFGILSVDDLLAFAEGGGLGIVPGFSERSADRLVAAIRLASHMLPAMELAAARKLAAEASEQLRALREPPVVVGDLRRGRSIVRSVELLAIDRNPGRATDLFGGPGAPGELHVLTASRAERTMPSGLRLVLHAAKPDERAVALVRTTGSVRHVRELVELAKRKGLEFRGFSLGGAPEPPGSEEDVYALLGLRFIPPELREGTGEIDDAAG